MLVLLIYYVVCFNYHYQFLKTCKYCTSSYLWL